MTWMQGVRHEQERSGERDERGPSASRLPQQPAQDVKKQETGQPVQQDIGEVIDSRGNAENLRFEGKGDKRQWSVATALQTIDLLAENAVEEVVREDARNPGDPFDGKTVVEDGCPVIAGKGVSNGPSIQNKSERNHDDRDDKRRIQPHRGGRRYWCRCRDGFGTIFFLFTHNG